MKKIDYYTWYLHLTDYKKQNPESKFKDYLETTEGIFKIKYLIEELYAEEIKKTNISEFIAKAEQELTTADIERILKTYEKVPNNEVLILNKLEKFGKKNPTAPLMINTETSSELLSLIKKIKDIVGDSSEDEIDEVIEDLNEEFDLDNVNLLEEDELMYDEEYDIDDDEEIFENLDDFDEDDFYDDSDY